jgi:hypothetical protein
MLRAGVTKKGINNLSLKKKVNNIGSPLEKKVKQWL